MFEAQQIFWWFKNATQTFYRSTCRNLQNFDKFISASGARSNTAATEILKLLA